MRVAVTGAGGFIGRAVTRELEARGHVPLAIDRHWGHDVCEADVMVKLTAGVDTVIHLAGVLGTSEILDDLHQAIAVNVGGTANMLEACRRNGARYIGITMPDCWPSAYQATKLAGVRLAAAYENAYGLSVAHLRTFNVYGPGQAHGPGHPQKILPTFATAAHRGDPLPIWGDGSNTVDLVHVDDVAVNFAELVEHGFAGTWDCGSGVETRVIDVARLVCAAAGGRFLVEYLPMRAGETEGTHLAAKDYALGMSRPRWFMHDPRFAEAVAAYQPLRVAA